MLPAEPSPIRVPSWSRRRPAAVVAVAAATALLVGLHLWRPDGALGDTGYLVGVWAGAGLAWWGTYAAPRGAPARAPPDRAGPDRLGARATSPGRA